MAESSSPHLGRLLRSFVLALAALVLGECLGPSQSHCTWSRQVLQDPSALIAGTVALGLGAWRSPEDRYGGAIRTWAVLIVLVAAWEWDFSRIAGYIERDLYLHNAILPVVGVPSAWTAARLLGDQRALALAAALPISTAAVAALVAPGGYTWILPLTVSGLWRAMWIAVEPARASQVGWRWIALAGLVSLPALFHSSVGLFACELAR